MVRLLSLGTGYENAMSYIGDACEVAKQSICLRSRCGSVIVKDKKIIGRGFNSPPLNKCLENCLKDSLPEDFKSDKTCCVHAEQRAIVDALRNNPKDIQGSTLYFARLDLNNKLMLAGKPYCTICSKAALDIGIGEIVLIHDVAIIAYNSQEYNEISFKP